jgi:peptidoglycan/xylan/chitin deacetylase (PgdA/CDA1 family)
MGNSTLVSLTFDDGLRCQFEQAVPILDKYGFLATFFLVASTDPVFTDGIADHRRWPKIDWSENDVQLLKSMTKRGHEIGAHSVSHKRPQLDNDPKFEAEGSKRRIEAWLGEEIPSYCYPFCHVTEPIKNAVINAEYKQARGGANASYYASQGSRDWFNVDCRLITEKENVDGWVRSDCWHVLMFHGIGTWADGWSPITTETFAMQMSELAKHRDAGTVDVVTFQEGAGRLRSPK